MVGNDFNVLSNLSQGRWRGNYTPPQNLAVGAFIEAVVPSSSGTTGEVIYCDCGCHSAYGSAEEMDTLANAE